MRNIGIMGGTFNPIHLGHLILAETAYQELNLDKVLFMPSKNPPHKKNINILSDEVRADMVKCAIKNNKHFCYSNLELEREGITYTSDTLWELTEHGKSSDTYFFLMGADSFFDIEMWHKPKEVLDMCHVVVAVRNNISIEKLHKHKKNIENRYNANIHLLKMPNIDISSSEIRKSISLGIFNKYYVPLEVYDYIKKNNLYK